VDDRPGIAALNISTAFTRNTRMTAIAGIVVLAAVIGGVHTYRKYWPDPASSRSAIASVGARACFNDARADERNKLVSDANLQAFCACTLDQVVATMSDEEAQKAFTNTLVLNTTMRAKLPAANASCKSYLLD
jgi:hypothetical protein